MNNGWGGQKQTSRGLIIDEPLYYIFFELKINESRQNLDDNWCNCNMNISVCARLGERAIEKLSIRLHINKWTARKRQSKTDRN